MRKLVSEGDRVAFETNPSIPLFTSTSFRSSESWSPDASTIYLLVIKDAWIVVLEISPAVGYVLLSHRRPLDQHKSVQTEE